MSDSYGTCARALDLPKMHRLRTNFHTRSSTILRSTFSLQVCQVGSVNVACGLRRSAIVGARVALYAYTDSTGCQCTKCHRQLRTDLKTPSAGIYRTFFQVASIRISIAAPHIKYSRYHTDATSQATHVSTLVQCPTL